jgi:hypothetical protein
VKYALGNMLNGAGGSGLDTDAKAYINAVVSAGATVTATQRDAINAFVKGGKTDGWWSSMKRIYLPIWSAASPNAIDIVSRASGTFTGTVTHASGYVQGDGTTGYFNVGVTPSSLGMTTSGGSAFALVSQSDSRTDIRFFIGQTDSSNRRIYLRQTGASVIDALIYSASAPVANSTSARNGIFLATINATNDRYLKRRGVAGITYTSTNTTNDTTVSSTLQNPFVMANNNNGPAASFSDARLGVYGLGLGLSSADGDTFTLAIKTLWETCTGLSLP